uniref:Uncharacterized protein n=1 Tax=Vitis vinifera TaxID=29760 RepID=F6H9K8_VITVI
MEKEKFIGKYLSGFREKRELYWEILVSAIC